MFWLGLAAQMAVRAAFVLPRRALRSAPGRSSAELVATLPVSARPAYLFVSLEHDSAFVAESALTSLFVNRTSTCLALTSMRVAQACGLVPSLGAAVGGPLGSSAALVLALAASVRWNCRRHRLKI
jgi:hypothetical protein